MAALAVAGPASAATEDTTIPGDTPGSLAAYVHDVHSGKVTLLVEGHQVDITDRALVAKLAQAFAKADRATGGR